MSQFFSWTGYIHRFFHSFLWYDITFKHRSCSVEGYITLVNIGRLLYLVETCTCLSPIVPFCKRNRTLCKCPGVLTSAFSSFMYICVLVLAMQSTLYIFFKEMIGFFLISNMNIIFAALWSNMRWCRCCFRQHQSHMICLTTQVNKFPQQKQEVQSPSTVIVTYK